MHRVASGANGPLTGVAIIRQAHQHGGAAVAAVFDRVFQQGVLWEEKFVTECSD
jgi:hypothetical protein